jgi:hypothetical protein
MQLVANQKKTRIKLQMMVYVLYDLVSGDSEVGDCKIAKTCKDVSQ